VRAFVAATRVVVALPMLLLALQFKLCAFLFSKNRELKLQNPLLNQKFRETILLQSAICDVSRK
jgi:hypothetical protein